MIDHLKYIGLRQEHIYIFKNIFLSDILYSYRFIYIRINFSGIYIFTCRTMVLLLWSLLFSVLDLPSNRLRCFFCILSYHPCGFRFAFFGFNFIWGAIYFRQIYISGKSILKFYFFNLANLE